MRDIAPFAPCIPFLCGEGCGQSNCRKTSRCFNCCSGCGDPCFEHSRCSCRAPAFKALDCVFSDVYDDGDYSYDRFIGAFNMVFGNSGLGDSLNLNLTPERDWFDVDMALKKDCSYFAHFSKNTMAKVRQVATSVNRWNFMKVVMLTGEDFMTCSLAFTLKTLAMLVTHVDFRLPELKILDAGCGTGFLVAVANQLSRSDAEVWGLDLDANIVHIARRELFESNDSFTHDSCSREERLKKIRIVKGDVQLMVAGCADAKGVDNMLPFPEGYFDVINIGVAMPVPKRAVDCLNDGGLLLLPAEAVDYEERKNEDYHNADDAWTRRRCVFQVWRKRNGKLVPVLSSRAESGSNVTFIKAKSISSYNSTLSTDGSES